MHSATIDDASIRRIDPTLFRYARRRVGNDDLARDLVQETWAAGLRSLDGFAGRAQLSTWLVAILRRKIIDMHRRNRHLVEIREDHLVTQESEREALDDRATLARVATQLEALPERERRALTLVDIRGVERDQAAEDLSVTRNNLRVLLHRARRHLRDLVQAPAPALAA
ncbi:MAG: sigma-70 family RNA polymerase sigma factor [Deltaproteobacteria bacterium]|nr:sigma-70 family RNA polymerase sigma factor [Deltaproteobacteria bacterium]